MRGVKRKTRLREHRDLQIGQSGVQFEEAGWNRADIVIAKGPKRKKVGMRRMTKKNKNMGI